MRVTPKISVSPDAMRKSTIAFASPLRSWIARNGRFSRLGVPTTARLRPPRRALVGGAELLYFFVGGQHPLPGDVLVARHDAGAALRVELRDAHPRAHCRLAV